MFKKQTKTKYQFSKPAKKYSVRCIKKFPSYLPNNTIMWIHVIYTVCIWYKFILLAIKKHKQIKKLVWTTHLKGDIFCEKPCVTYRP